MDSRALVAHMDPVSAKGMLDALDAYAHVGPADRGPGARTLLAS
ncbi:MAG TPA: hypothetical protein VK923_21005 [Euzebyales bacterium]|nr:hypothetical protein [Euzebyales bacterium]